MPLATASALATASTHPSVIPLAVAGVALWLAAAVVRKIVKLALLVAVVGAVALGYAAWRSGVFTG